MEKGHSWNQELTSNLHRREKKAPRKSGFRLRTRSFMANQGEGFRFGQA